MDLATGGEPAIYRVDDIGLPTTITPRATVHGVRAWLVARVAALHTVVAKAI